MRSARWLAPAVTILAMGWALAQEGAQIQPQTQTQPQSPAKVQAQPQTASSQLTVKRSVIAREVVDREPQGEATTFSADVGQVSCFSQITGAPAEGTHIYHLWLHGETERAKVKLNVMGPSWRTWSNKRILPAWTGSWKVQIQDADGNVLETLAFTIE